MKMKSFFIAALLACTMYVHAALPNPLMFNTAINSSYSGLVGLGNAGNNWQVALTNIAGPYYFARQAWVAGWVGSPSTLSSWVTYPQHNCSGATNIAEHWCLGPSAANPSGVKGDVEEFYKINFELPEYVCGLPVTQQGAYNLAIKFWADNFVRRVYINGNLFWSATPGSPYNVNDNHSNLSYGQLVNMNQYWLAGPNEIIVETLSGAPNNVGWSGFMAVVDVAKTTQEPCGEGDPTSCCLGNYCGASKNALYANYEIPLNSNNFFYAGDALKADKLNVGLPCSTMFPGKFNVTTAKPSDPTAGSNDSYSIYGTNTNNLNNSTNTGVYGSAIGSQEESNTNERGVWGIASGGADARGVFGQGKVASRSYGGYFESITSNQGINYGVYGVAANGSAGNWAGYFQGDVTISGNGWVNGVVPITSDKRFKTNITELSNVSEKLKNLKGYTYMFKTEEFKDRNFPKTEQIGFIAQELKEIFPQLVLENSDGYYGVNYMGFIPVLLQAAKEQQHELDQQKESLQKQQQQIDELKSLVTALSGNPPAVPQGATTSVPVTLSDKNAVVLNQNVPNPFAESTVITYNIPSDFTRAQIIFTTSEGKIIKTVDILTKGTGSLSVFANDLTHGIYSYALVVDGKTIDTKKMIKE